MAIPPDVSLDAEDLLTGDDKIIAEAKRRFNRCEEWEATARRRWMDDYKFANGDSDNGYQWPNRIYSERQVAARPTLTINKTQQHCLQIVNDARQNKPSVRVRPIGNEATYESAEVFEGVVRHIENISNAQSAYDRATTFQVQGGIGYWRVVTDYANDDTFDQEIFIRPVADPLSIYIDPDIKEQDGSDARYSFVFDDLPRDQFRREYPEFEDQASSQPLGNNVILGADTWMSKEYVRVAEYYRVSEKKDELVAIRDENTGVTKEVRRSKLPSELYDALSASDPEMRTRSISTPVVEWYKIAGNKIIDRTIIPGRYIPIVRVIGTETIIEGRLDRKGHVRALIDPQRMVNYWTSAATEFVALQGKTPWLVTVDAMEGYETYWSTANTINHAYLPWNHRSDDGNVTEIPKPERAEPPQMAQAYIEGLKMSYEQMMLVSGQYQADFGAPSNEKSGKAINERQRQGDNATYHFIDNLALAIRYTGKILIDLIPKVYDNERILRILGEDGTEHEVVVDPNARAAYFLKEAKHGETVRGIFNPNVGKYDVEADVGPAYATKRQEAWNAFTQIAAQDPALMSIIGDLMFQNADFPGADKIAERMRRLVPPQATGEGPPPAVQKLQGQVQMASHALQEALQKNAELELKLQGKDEQKDIDVYEAITSRLKVMLPTIVNPAEIARMVHDLAMQEHKAGLDQITAANQADLDADAQGQSPDSGQQAA